MLKRWALKIWNYCHLKFVANCSREKREPNTYSPTCGKPKKEFIEYSTFPVSRKWNTQHSLWLTVHSCEDATKFNQLGNKINKVHQKLMGKQEQTLTASHSDVGLWTNYRTLDLDRTLLLKKKNYKNYLLFYNKN